MPGFEVFGADEKKEVNDVLNSGILFRYGFDNLRNNVWKVKKFEKAIAKRLNVKYCHVCSSGTSALFSALATTGIGFSDEVIVSPFTFIATIEAILMVGAIPIFSEIDETLCLSPKHIEKKITKKTKAILVVHMCGAMAKIDEISNITKRSNLILIEDACQSFGATFKNKTLGTFGSVGCFSFDFVKTITCGEGGAIITNNKKTYIAVDSFNDHGHNHLGVERGLDDHNNIGTNARMSEINAAIGIAQLSKLDFILEKQKKYKSIIIDHIKKIKGIQLRHIPDVKGDSSTFISFFMPNIEKTKIVCSEFNNSKIIQYIYWYENKWHYLLIRCLNIYKKIIE